MKKLITTFFLCSLVLTMGFAAPKKGKSKSSGIKLDVKTKFAIEGVELGSIDWCKDDATLTPKGEVIWNQNIDSEWLHYGWALRGTDMSQYAGLKIQVTPLPGRDDLRVELTNPASSDGCTFRFENDGICYVFFNGSGRGYGEMKNPDPTQGYEIRFLVNKNNLPKTIIKSIELLSIDAYPDTSYLDLLGVQFGSTSWQARVIGNEIIWPKGYSDGHAGWNLEGIDLSEYDRIHIELESNTATGFHISINEKDGKNYHTFNTPLQPNVYDIDLGGEGYSYKNDDASTPDKSKGFTIALRTWNEKSRTKEQKTVVKSVQLLKGKRIANENLMIEDKALGSSSNHSYVYDGGVIDWEYDGKEKYPFSGWNVKGVDLSKWKIIRVEVAPESSAANLSLKFYQEKSDAGFVFYAKSRNILEANLDYSNYDYKWENKSQWDFSSPIDDIWIGYEKLTKTGEKTIIKSITLLAEDDGSEQPSNLMLNGEKLGSKRDNNSWMDDDFSINWKKANYSQCGWKFEELKGNFLEIKVASTDTPLRLRIRTFADKNESSWDDDGSHVFRINLKTKKSINKTGGEKAGWEKMTKPLDYSQGGEIVLEPLNGVFKDGKKTVVEYIKVE